MGRSDWRRVTRKIGPDCPVVIPPCSPPVTLTWIELESMANRWVVAMTPARLADAASDLGVSGDSLTRMRAGWSAIHGAVSFPMTGPVGRVVGIRLRKPGGRKFSVTGGKEGLFVPTGVLGFGDALAVCEGPTDTAAALDVGLHCIGRPNCSGGRAQIVGLLAGARVESLIVIADNDGPGQDGAQALLSSVNGQCAKRIVTPPSDMRAWLQSESRAEILSSVLRKRVDRLNLRW